MWVRLLRGHGLWLLSAGAFGLLPLMLRRGAIARVLGLGLAEPFERRPPNCEVIVLRVRDNQRFKCSFRHLTEVMAG
ncbi:MAG: hypothetical protein ACREFP_12490 [Acetobacteraceae bacterium]